MAYRLQNSLRNILGVNIDQIVNTPEAKETAKHEWKYYCQFRRFEDECAEREYKKYQTWLEKFHWSTYRWYKKYGDRYKIVQWIREQVSSKKEKK